MTESEEEQYQYAEASCLKHREVVYVAEGCGRCSEDAFAEYQESFREPRPPERPRFIGPRQQFPDIGF
jgi:hypothetical protein